MASMETWVNGASGLDVRRAIENNFNTLFKHLDSNVLALTTNERKLLGNDYVREGLRVYDIDLDKWFKYTNHSWVECSSETEGSLDFEHIINTTDWIDNVVYISFDMHNISNPIVQLYIKCDDGYYPVIGGVSVNNTFDITISSDIPFEGKVVVK